MRFLFVTLAGSGHFHPLVPVAQAVQAKGHVVCFAAAPSFHSNVVGSGFQAVAAGFDRERDGCATKSRRCSAACGSSARGALSDALPDSSALRGPVRRANGSRPARDRGGLAAGRDRSGSRRVWRLRGCRSPGRIPHASVRSNTMLSTYSGRHLVSKEMSELRAAYRLAPDPDTAMLFRYLHLAFEPPGFHDPALPLAPTSHLLRPVR